MWRKEWSVTIVFQDVFCTGFNRERTEFLLENLRMEQRNFDHNERRVSYLGDDKMIYIYNCYGGTHSSALAAAYHLKKLPLDREPTDKEILNIDVFNKLTPKDMGKLIFHGYDEDKNEVYTLGRGSSKVVVPAMYELADLLNKKGGLQTKILFSNTSPTVPLAMTLGGFFSRRLKINVIGVPLLIIGAKQAHKKIIRLVEQTKKSAKVTASKIEVLDNSFSKQ